MDIQFNLRKSATSAFITNTILFFEQELKLKKSTWSMGVFTKRGMAKETNARGYVSKIGPKHLIMVLDSSLDTERMVLTIAHEMVHAKQYARGQLKNIPDRLQTKYWMGKKVNKRYHEQPWELEAFGKERVLANKIFQIINK
jgi:Zn-dependent peptidase ImmA (M78 family)